jgi:hypothetical protein
MPFGFLQFVSILITSYAVAKWKYKGPILVASIFPVVVGLAIVMSKAPPPNSAGRSL